MAVQHGADQPEYGHNSGGFDTDGTGNPVTSKQSNQANPLPNQIMKNPIFLLPLFVLLLLTACEEELTPPEVTDAFWHAIVTEDREGIRKQVSRDTTDEQISGQELLTIQSWATGRILIDGNRSEVDTMIVVAGEKPLEMTIKTYLVDENGLWKVEYGKTVEQIRDQGEVGRVLNRLDDISSQMLDGLDKSIEDLQDAMPIIERELSKMEENLKEKVPEIRKRLDEFVRKLEEALKQKESPPPQQEPVEI